MCWVPNETNESTEKVEEAKNRLTKWKIAWPLAFQIDSVDSVNGYTITWPNWKEKWMNLTKKNWLIRISNEKSHPERKKKYNGKFIDDH